MFFEKERKTQIVTFSWNKKNQNVIFWLQIYFKIWHVEKNLIQNLTFCFIWKIKTLSVVEFLFQNLTRCKIFNSKSDISNFFHLKLWRAVKLLFQKLNFNFFQVLFEWVFLLRTVNLFEYEFGLRQKALLLVWSTCLSYNRHILFGNCHLYGIWVFDVCDDYFICTTNWFKQASL